MEDAAHILVVDDDTRLRELLHKYLIDQGFRVTTGRDAADARAKLNSIEFDLLIVDIMMPGESGLAFTQSLRRDSGVPILLLTAMSESEDRIRGLECGADDYLTKPFEPRELVLRINAILRRATQEVAPVEGQVQLGAYRFDPIREELQCDGGFIKLTTAEAALLKALARRARTPISRKELSLSSRFSGNMRSVDVQVARLRRKIETDPRYPRYLQTVRGTGYVLIPD
jgi:two-component system phosphate regulon response regulator OmpR